MTGKVLELARRPGKDEPMEVMESFTLVEGSGLTEDYGKSAKRQVTLISREAWDQVQAELDRTLPWHTRRANVLVEGVDLGSTIGHTLELGECRLEILGETVPCQLMDDLVPDLRGTLGPEVRGGVYGRVIGSGTVRPGDVVRRVETSAS